MQNLKKLFNKYYLILLIIAIVPTVWALTVPGYYGASDDLHIGWLYEMDQVVKLGQFPPRFVPDLSFGFGYPLFNFAFPLPFYIGEIFHLLGLSFVDSVKLVFGISLIGSGISMMWLLRKITNNYLSFLGALIYVYTPYRSTDIYVRGDIGEALSFIFLPLIILSIIEISENKNTFNLKSIGIGALSVAGLVLTHNITVYMFLPFAMLFGLIQILSSDYKKAALLKLISFIALGLLISIYFWLPALIDSSLVKYDTVFNFIDHFPTISQLLTPYWGYGASVPGPGDGMSFFIGIANLFILVFGIGVFVLSRNKFNLLQKNILIWSIVTFIVSFLMMNYRSTFLWQRLPLLPYFQFPWRFLIMTTFVTSIFVITLEKVKFNRIISILFLLMIVSNFSIFHPHDYLGRTDQYYINRYIPVPEASNEYKNLQEEYLRLPKTTQLRPDHNFPPVDNLNKNIHLTEKAALDLTVNVSSNSATKININKYNFPGWMATLDGQPVKLFSDYPFGQIGAIIPSGNHQLRVYFGETIFKLILDVISVVFLIFSMILIFWRPKKSRA